MAGGHVRHIDFNFFHIPFRFWYPDKMDIFVPCRVQQLFKPSKSCTTEKFQIYCEYSYNTRDEKSMKPIYTFPQRITDYKQYQILVKEQKTTPSSFYSQLLRHLEKSPHAKDFDIPNSIVYFSGHHAVIVNIEKKIGYYWMIIKKKALHFDENILCFLSSIGAIENESMLLHGLSIKHRHSAYLFLGYSGTGKSTIAKLYNEKECYSDDVVLIRHQNNQFFAYPTPFYQFPFSKEHLRVTPAPIRYIFFIQQSLTTSVEPITDPLMVLPTILYEYIQFSRLFPPEYHRILVESIHQMVNTIPTCKLLFNHNEKKIFDLIDHIEGLL